MRSYALFTLSAAFTLSLLSSTARAAPTIINVQMGLPLLLSDVTLDSNVKVGAKMMIGADMVKPLESLPFALGVFYQGYFASTYGSLPLNNTGFAVYYYPFGMANHSYNLDGNVSVYTWRMAMFARVNAGFTFFNYRDPTGVAIFGATGINTQFAGGLDYPLNDWLSVGGEAAFLVTFGATRPDGNQPVNASGYIFSTRFCFTWP